VRQAIAGAFVIGRYISLTDRTASAIANISTTVLQRCRDLLHTVVLILRYRFVRYAPARNLETAVFLINLVLD